MRYVEDSCSIELSLDELCERALKKTNYYIGSRAAIGEQRITPEIYEKVRGDAGAFYRAEVPLSNTFALDGIYYTVDAVADGIIHTREGYQIDEIVCAKEIDFIAPPKDALLAKMKCIAYFLACREDLERIKTRLALVSTESGKIKFFSTEHSTEELRSFYRSMLCEIKRDAMIMKQRVEVALPSARSVTFPYSELREGQELMIRETYRAIKRGKRLFVNAPTGTGKTISALYPAVRALGEGKIDRIFYLTAKSSTRREAYRAAGKLFEAGAHLRTVVLHAKDFMCAHPSKLVAHMMGGERPACDKKKCELLRGYYERSQDAVFELLSRQNGFTAQIISEVARKYRICPYELSLDLSEYCDIIICDYNYVFDPSVYLRRYFSEDGERGRYVFLFDEAHNLADRARDMYSATLRRSEFERVYARIDPSLRELNEAFEGIMMTVRSKKRLCKDSLTRGEDGEERGFYMNKALPEELTSELDKFRKTVSKWLKKNEDRFSDPDLDRLLESIRRFVTVSEYFDDRFLFYIEIFGGDMLFKIFCLDPSDIADRIQKRAVSTLFFSATLTPPDYFVDVLGGGKDASYVSIPSPYDGDRLLVLNAPYISTKFEDREKSLKKYVSVIAATVSAKAGNYIVYFPSYRMLRDVAEAFEKKYPSVSLIIQSQNMSNMEKEEFLENFKDDSGKLRVGFCVLGGSFAEGIDLPGSRLIGTVIFGVGLPGLSNENNIIRDYYDVQNGEGYDYAYTFPGMNNVLQAVGRVIRQAEDKGVAVLVDDRYLTEKYRELFPSHWTALDSAENVQELAEKVREFWNKN